jgi:hypothetical protein
VHTRHIPKLGWFEWFFVTPSNHRAHHAQNALYMDRNYGGVFIIWDRLFGSFQEEDDNEPVIFGVTTPLASWNPMWANLRLCAVVGGCAARPRAGKCGSGSCAPVGRADVAAVSRLKPDRSRAQRAAETTVPLVGQCSSAVYRVWALT